MLEVNATKNMNAYEAKVNDPRLIAVKVLWLDLVHFRVRVKANQRRLAERAAPAREMEKINIDGEL